MPATHAEPFFTADRLWQWTLSAFCALLFVYFIMHSIMGDNGLLKMSALSSQVKVAKLQLQDLQKDRAAMETRAKLLRPDSLDLDMLDERARAMLGYTKPNEYVIYYDKKK